MTEQPTSERSIFLAAIERSPEERAAFVDQTCAGDPRLREAVNALLAAHDRLAPIHPAHVAEPAATIDQSETTGAPGSVIGPYKLIEQIGEGGMGTVWMAQQTEPVKRLVALKLIKAGIGTA